MSVQFLYLVDLTGFNTDTGLEETLRFSTGKGFVTPPTDSPANTLYEPRVHQAVEITRSIHAPGTTSGQSKIGFGDLVLLNPDGALDYLISYAFDGRAVRVRRGLVSATQLADFTDVFVGLIEQAEFDNDYVTYKLRDKQAPLQLPLQSLKYDGSNALPNGFEGVAQDLAGKPKPIVFGRVLNVSPPCVNTSFLVYELDNRGLTSIDAVYDRGVALTYGGTFATEAEMLDVLAAPAAGEYKVYLPKGRFALGSSPSGTITADATQGATLADRTAAQLFEAVLLFAGVAGGDILASDITTLDTQNAAECGLYVSDVISVATVLDMLAETVGAWWGVNVAGEYRIVRLDRPMGTAALSFEANDLIGPPIRQSTADPERGLPAYSVVVRYARNYTVQTTDLAGSVAADRRAFLAEEWREATATDTSVQTVHLLAAVLQYTSLFIDSADALAEASRRLLLRAVQRHRFDIRVAFDSETATLDLGDIVGLRHPRFNLDIEGSDEGQLFVVIGVEPNALDRDIRFTLWGNSFTTFNLVSSIGEFLVADDGSYLITGAY